MMAPSSNSKDICCFQKTFEPSFMFIGHCTVVFAVFCGLCTLVKELNARYLVGFSSPPMLKLIHGAPGAHNQPDSLIGWPQPADMWLCLGACRLIVAPPCALLG